MALRCGWARPNSVAATESSRASGEAHVHVTIGGFASRSFRVRKRDAQRNYQHAVARVARTDARGLLTGDAQVDAELASAFQDATGTDTM